MTPVRVAVVDDSSFVRKALQRVLSREPRIEVVGAAASGEELLAALDRWRPEVVTLDLAMPGMGGLRTLDHLMARRPLPVIVLSTHSHRGAPLTLEALHRGAVDFIDKQRYSLVDFGALGEVLIAKILQVAGRETAAVAPTRSVAAPARPAALPEAAPFDLLLIGASTGGPPAIQRVLEDLGAPLPLPAIVAQHMPEGFTSAFAERLNSRLPVAVREAVDGESLLPGTVYIAPAGRHFRVRETRSGLVADLEVEPEASHRPSVDVLFSSASRLTGRRVIALLLTGMGRDGSQGMADLAAAGAYTMAQDEKSSVVWGMPRAAIALNAVREALPLPRIGGRLRELLTRGA